MHVLQALPRPVARPATAATSSRVRAAARAVNGVALLEIALQLPSARREFGTTHVASIAVRTQLPANTFPQT